MGKEILSNAQACDALHAITRRLRRELLNADFTQEQQDQLQLIINAHAKPSEGIRVDLIEKKRRKQRKCITSHHIYSTRS